MGYALNSLRTATLEVGATHAARAYGTTCPLTRSSDTFSIPSGRVGCLGAHGDVAQLEGGEP